MGSFGAFGKTETLGGRDGLPLSVTWTPAKAVRKVEFKLLQISEHTSPPVLTLPIVPGAAIIAYKLNLSRVSSV
jgi:hypothetical protein